ncbi:MAG: HAMP domain-containing sensor histidine kinase [Acidobacteriota bacterium]
MSWWLGSSRLARGPWSVVALLAVVVLLPTAGVLWFMDQAVRNERFAVRQRLADAYRAQLAALEREILATWLRRSEQLAAAGEGAAAFARCVREGWATSAVILAADGSVVYPAPPREPSTQAIAGVVELADAWRTAERLERLDDPARAAAAWGEVADRASDPQLIGRALQGRLRSLARLGEVAAVVELASGRLAAPELAGARDPRERLIAPDGLLLALRQLNSEDDPRTAALVEALRRRLASYDEPAMPATQRRFLAAQLTAYLSPGESALDTVAAEELAARYLAEGPSAATPGELEPAGLPEVWRLASLDGRVVGLFEQDAVLAWSLGRDSAVGWPSESRLRLKPPGADASPQVLAGLTLEAPLTGWRLELTGSEDEAFDVASQRQISIYRWAGILTVVGVLLLAGLVAARLTAQMRLTELKNDFLANVSHELKTPLASTRLLVDTLLDQQSPDPQQTREYLELIAAENVRLSHLVDSFLTFSRMERGTEQWDLRRSSPRQIVETAAAAVRERISAAGGRLEVQLAEPLPDIEADREALISVLVNLLDNGCKFSPGDPRLSLSATAVNGSVDFAVSDRGVGIPRRSLEKIFERFYQVDQRLSRRAGGTGLGLSIVRHIVEAHGGTVMVASEVGQGSTFTVRLPTLDDPSDFSAEA